MSLFLKRNIRILLGAAIIYCIGLLLGVFFSDILPVEEPAITKDPTIFEFFIHNLLANILISFTIFTFGIFTVALLITNGFLVGLSSIHSLEQGNNLLYVLTALVPHGIFEIPAMILAGAMGFKLLDAMYMKLKGIKKLYLIKDSLVLTVTIIFLTFAAAITETKVTPYLLNQL